MFFVEMGALPDSTSPAESLTLRAAKLQLRLETPLDLLERKVYSHWKPKPLYIWLLRPSLKCRFQILKSLKVFGNLRKGTLEQGGASG